MTGKIFKKAGLMIVIGAGIWACSKEDTKVTTPDRDLDRKAVLVNLADNVIVPSYANFKTRFDIMLTKSAAFAAKPEIASLGEFRQAWVDAYTEWQKAEVFDFGPAARNGITNYYNIYPTNVTGITQYINNPAENFEVTASYDKQGFPALDYLLNGVGKTDAEIVAWYLQPTDGAKRLAYIKRINDHMDALLKTVMSEWTGTYYTNFTTKTGTDIGSPMGEMVNGYILHYERYVRSGKFGIPSGAMLNGVVSADKVEAFYKKDISKALAQTAHQAAVDFFNGKNVKTGTDGPSFKSYLDALGAKDAAAGKLLSEIINTQFSANKTKMDALKPSLYQEVTTNNQAMKDVYTELQKAVRMLKVDMTSAMSITITYTDNDGD
jgi:predicted lipoprotein